MNPWANAGAALSRAITAAVTPMTVRRISGDNVTPPVASARCTSWVNESRTIGELRKNKFQNDPHGLEVA
ncbi:hypothetical protein Pph01_63680 [Planotetraspora phitsanulokensis]|uniref:Uncharacterized protein n=1 Tax=Planotetraspora phitsanulokensis TaxID=575192 RepID=A0A8J3UAN5_9ACTN|nr:hypothetical protein Pph01_63680 [Planotetraspora phitsanulokensis]